MGRSEWRVLSISAQMVGFTVYRGRSIDEVLNSYLKGEISVGQRLKERRGR